MAGDGLRGDDGAKWMGDLVAQLCYEALAQNLSQRAFAEQAE
jgi:hypothetical protein